MADRTSFETWWETRATDEEKARLTSTVENGSTLDSQLVRAMSTSGVLLIGVSWSGDNFAFHPTEEMNRVILGDEGDDETSSGLDAIMEQVRGERPRGR